MFGGASSFNQPLNDWDVSSVTSMSYMFSHATSFNQPLNDWDVSSVISMKGMFGDATSFNQPLNDWDVSSVTDMEDMFTFSLLFEQNLGNWYIVLEDTEVASGDTEVTTITTQNSYLDGLSPVYSVESGGDGDLFEMRGNVLHSVSPEYAKQSYDITIVSTSDLDLSVSKDVTITVFSP